MVHMTKPEVRPEIAMGGRMSVIGLDKRAVNRVDTLSYFTEHLHPREERRRLVAIGW